MKEMSPLQLKKSLRKVGVGACKETTRLGGDWPGGAEAGKRKVFSPHGIEYLQKSYHTGTLHFALST
jgi:hypothetical protein